MIKLNNVNNLLIFNVYSQDWKIWKCYSNFNKLKLLTENGKIYRYGQFSTSFNDVKLNEYFVNNCENHFTDFIINQPFDEFIKPYMEEHLSQIKGLLF